MCQNKGGNDFSALGVSPKEVKSKRRKRKKKNTSGGGRKAAWAKKTERLKVGNNNGQLSIANATSGGARKAAWAKMSVHFENKKW